MGNIRLVKISQEKNLAKHFLLKSIEYFTRAMAHHTFWHSKERMVVSERESNMKIEGCFDYSMPLDSRTCTLVCVCERSGVRYL